MMIWRPYSRLIVQGHFGEPTLAHHFSVRQACPFRSGAARHGHCLGMGPLAEGYGRLHDLRHTFRHSSRRRRRLRVTMLALIGYMSQSMLERYLAHSNDSKTGCGSGITLRQKGENSEVVPVKVPVASNRRDSLTRPGVRLRRAHGWRRIRGRVARLSRGGGARQGADSPGSRRRREGCCPATIRSR